MKYLLLLLLVCTGFSSTGQIIKRLQPFAGVGITTDGAFGGSITLDYKPIKWIGVGVGVHEYSYRSKVDYGNSVMVPAAFVDLRLFMPIQKFQIFAYGNFGKGFKDYAYTNDMDLSSTTQYDLMIAAGLGASVRFSRFAGMYIDFKMIQQNFHPEGSGFGSLFASGTSANHDFCGVFSIGYTF
jgi:hypothetical protein